MNLIALETSTEACSVALLHEDKITARFEIAPQAHAQLILKFVNELLYDAKLKIKDLDAIAFGCGPGSFTGVRIATSVAQGLAFAHTLPVIPVSTLHALAYGAYERLQEPFVFAAMDARMNEIYYGFFEFSDTGILKSSQEYVGPVQLIEWLPGKWAGVGENVATFKKMDAEKYPRARHMTVIAKEKLLEGNTISPEAALPVYLRDKVVAHG